MQVNDTGSAINEVRDAAFRHVRLQLSASMIAPGNTLDPAAVASARAVVDRIAAAGLAVVLVPYDLPASLWANADALVALDRDLAAAFSHTDPGLVFLEVADEPVHEDPRAWNAVQRRAMPGLDGTVRVLETERDPNPARPTVRRSRWSAGPG